MTGREKNGRYKKGHKSSKFWLGKNRPKQSMEVKEKISASSKGVKKSSTHRDNISKSKEGEKNPSWKGGKFIVPSGHILVRSTDHPMRNVNGYVYEHRLVMENKIGRILEKSEIVHHIDLNPGNNDLENLFLTERKGHSKVHRSLENITRNLIKDGTIKFNPKTGEYGK